MIRKITSIVTLCLLVLYSVDSFPCTALYIPQSPHQVFATNIDWNFGGGIIYINKRDVQKTSAYVTPPQTPLQWTSKYMSVTIDQTGLEFPWEGMNEQGVAITLAQLPSTRLAAINSQPEVNGSQFIQYLLDTSASTVDAIANSQSVQVTGPFAAEEHYIVCDSSGVCAVIENLYGTLVIHQGASLPYPVLANNGYPRSVNNLNALLAVDTPNQILALTGTDSLTRFAKAAVWAQQYSSSSDDVSYAFSGLNAVRQPTTQWQAVFSLANLTLQWETTGGPTIKSLSLSQFDPHCSAGVQMYHVNSHSSGDMTASFTAFSTSANDSLILSSASTNGLAIYDVATLQAYPGALTQCMEENATLKASPAVSGVGQSVSLSAHVAGKGGSTPTGTVTFMNGTTTLGVATLDSTGSAAINTTTLPVGTNSVTAVYNSDNSNPSVTSPAWVQTVYTYAPQIAVTSTTNPALLSQNVVFTASVTGQQGPAPTGTIAFVKDKLTQLGIFPINGGNASVGYTFALQGSKNITVNYSGDANFAPGTSVLIEGVGLPSEGLGAEPTATVVTSNPNPAAVNQTVKLTATVSSTLATGTPQGIVIFLNGNMQIGVAQLNANGQASITASFGGVGLNPLSAIYAGSTTYASSTSPVLAVAAH